MPAPPRQEDQLPKVWQSYVVVVVVDRRQRPLFMVNVSMVASERQPIPGMALHAVHSATEEFACGL
eukprot:3128800-Prymnesium_polylepis.1